MARVKQIVCLANSRKLAGRCIAGREWTTESGAGDWIRPVSERKNREVSEYERQYEDGSDPQVLDIVQVPVLKPQPDGYQRENWLLDNEYYWEKVGVLSDRFAENCRSRGAALGRRVQPLPWSQRSNDP